MIRCNCQHCRILAFAGAIGSERRSPESRLTDAELRATARALSADGYTVVLDDCDLWVGLLGAAAWRRQLEARVANAMLARESVARAGGMLS